MKRRDAVLVTVLAATVCAAAGVLVWRALPSPRTGEVFVVLVEGQRSATANEVQIATPIEHALANVPGVTRVRSESRASGVSATCIFGPQVDSMTAAQDVRAAIEPMLRALPQETSPPIVRRASADEPPLWAIGDQHVRELLQVLPGVAGVEACGETEDHVRVSVDAARMSAMGLELDAVLHAIRAASPDRDLLRIRGQSPDIQELSRTPLTRVEPMIRLADIATVAVQPRSTGCEATLAGEPKILARITLQRGANRSEVTKAVAAKVRASGGRWLDPTQTVVLAVAVPRPASRGLASKIAADIAGARGVTSVAVARHDERDEELEIVVSVDTTEAKPSMDALRQRASTNHPGSSWRGVRWSPFGMPAVLTVTLTGPELDALDERARDVEKRLEHVEGVGPLIGGRPSTTPFVDVEIDRERAARLGVPPHEIAGALRAAMGGEPVGARITVVLGDGDLASNPAGVLPSVLLRGLPLSQFVKLTMRADPSPILHLDGQRAVELRWEAEPALARGAVERALAGSNARVELSKP